MINILNNTLGKGTEGAKLDKRLEVFSDHIITKTKNDAFTNPELDQILRELEVSELYLTGLDAAECVQSTLQAALNRGYKISVIEELVIAENEDLKAEAMAEFKTLGAEVLQNKDFINTFRSKP